MKFLTGGEGGTPLIKACNFSGERETPLHTMLILDLIFVFQTCFTKHSLLGQQNSITQLSVVTH